MKNVRVARRYAVALLADAEQKSIIEPVAADIGTLEHLMRDSRELRRLVASRLVSAEKKLRIIDELFTSRFSKASLDFLHLLIDKQREALLPDIIAQFAALLNERLGVVTVDVTSAVEFAPAQVRAIHERLEPYTQKKVKVRFLLDAGIRGGVVVRIGDTVLDGSIRHQLELLRERLVGGTAS
jgi:F-type H+-transporting ATPase subunit delta